MSKRISKFSQITEQLPYPAGYRGILQSIHSTIVSDILQNSSVKRSDARHAVHVINLLSYRCIKQEDLQWDSKNPLIVGNDNIDDDDIALEIGDLYLSYRGIKWELDGIEIIPDYDSSDSSESTTTVKSSTDVEHKKETERSIQPTIEPKKIPKIKPNSYPKPDMVLLPTPQEDLSIQPPVIPSFDINSVRCAMVIGDRTWAIYDSLPLIPKKQNQISITTDINKMTKSDLRNLYPNCRVRVRPQIFYDTSYMEGLTYHPVLGRIIPIDGFTEAQVIDNIIKYPHLFNLSKLDGDEVIGFYSTIEIDGELHRILDYYKYLPEFKYIPMVKEYIREYVVRRYLLERDILGIEHKYPMFGTLEPFLTLFTTPDEYISLGYTDIEGMAKQCVQSRISYKRSRNPILKLIHEFEGAEGVSIYNTL